MVGVVVVKFSGVLYWVITKSGVRANESEEYRRMPLAGGEMEEGGKFGILVVLVLVWTKWGILSPK